MRAVSELRRLWRGDLPLVQAFWGYAVAWGLLVNLLTSAAFVALVATGWPVAALVAGYALSVPYNIVALVGVWRSAARHDGDPAHAEMARVATALLMAVLIAT